MYDVDPLDSLREVPDELLAPLAELSAALAVSPRTIGRPWTARNPTGLRVVTIAEGRALVVFGVLEHERRVAMFDLVVL